MTKKRFALTIILIVMLVLCVGSISAYAITDAEVQQYVDANGKEAASGNVFIWFICAIAFLKISQKIDSFMGSLGISVGHTGGSMLSEAMIAAKTIAGIGRSGRAGGGNGARAGASSGGGGYISGGLAGVVGRKFNTGAANAAADKDQSGIIGNLGGMAYEASVKKGGNLANETIGNIAKGSIAQEGAITGEKASVALQSYMGLSSESNSQVNTNASVNGNVTGNVTGSGGSKNVDVSGTVSGSPAGAPQATPNGAAETIPMKANAGEIPVHPSENIEGIPDAPDAPVFNLDNPASALEGTSIPNLNADDALDLGAETAGIAMASELADAEENSIPAAPIPDTHIPVSAESEAVPELDSEAIPVNVEPGTTGSIPMSSEDTAAVSAPNSAADAPQSPSSIPKFTNVEIGGGRITGTEVSAEHPGGRDFAMYHADQYMAPRQSSYEMVNMIDGSKWYKQYAVPTVEKTPYMGKKGKIEYKEKIVDKVPEVPKRKDRV